MESTPRKLIKLKPFKTRVCEEVYKRHPVVQMSCFKKAAFGRSVYTAMCGVCGEMRMLDEKALRELVDEYRAKGKVGFLFPEENDQREL